MSSKKIQGITIEIGGDVTQLDKELKKVDKGVSSLSKQLGDVERALKFNPSSTIFLTEKTDLLGASIEKAKEKLAMLNNVQSQYDAGNVKMSEEQYRAFRIELAMAESNVIKFEKSLVDVEKKTRDLNSTMAVSSDSIKSASESASAFDELLDNLEAQEKATAEEAERAAKSIEGIGQRLSVVSENLKLDPSNMELLEEHARLTKDQISALTEKLDNMKAAQLKVTEAFENKDIGYNEYQKFQSELSNTEEKLATLKTSLKGTDNAVNDLGSEMEDATKKTSVFGDVLKANLLSNAVMNGLQHLSDSVKNFVSGGIAQATQMAENQAKLTQVMQNTMNAAQGEVNAILDLADAQERLGVVGGDVQIAGAQELGTYLSKTETLKELLPVMNDMIAQQYGLNASQESAVSIGTMLGKVMNGQVSALSRYGYSFDDAQAQILKFGTESQRAAVLADVIRESVGGMNEALGQTDAGKAVRAKVDIENLQETVGQTAIDVKTALLGTMLPSIQEVTAKLSDFVSKNQNNIQGLTESVGLFVSHVLDNSDNVLSVLAGIGASFATWKAGNIIAGIVTSYKAWTVATKTQTIAQATLNTTTAAFPIGAIAAGIGVAVAAIGGIISAVNKAKKEQEEWNAAAERYNNIVSNGISQAEIGSYETQIQEMEVLKQTYEDVITVAKALQEDSYGVLTNVAAIDVAAEGLGVNIGELGNAFRDYNIEMELVDESGQLFAQSSESLSSYINLVSTAIKAAKVDVTKYGDVLNSESRRQMDSDKEVLQSRQKIVDQRVQSIDDLIQKLEEENSSVDANNALIQLNNIEIRELTKEREALIAETEENANKTKQLNDILAQSVNVAPIFNEQAKAYKYAAAESDALFGATNNLQSAYETLTKGEALNSTQLHELIQKYPQVAKYINDTNDVTLDRGRILSLIFDAEKDYNVNFLKMQEQQLEAEIAKANSAIEVTRREYLAKMQIMEEFYSVYAEKELDGVQRQMTAEQKSIQGLRNSLAEVKASISLMNSLSIDSSIGSKIKSSSGVGVSGGTKSSNIAIQEKNTLLDAEYDKIARNKSLGMLTAQQELDAIIAASRQHVKSDEEKLDAKKRIYDAVNALVDEESKAIIQARNDGKISAEEATNQIEALSDKYNEYISSFDLAASKSDELVKQHTESIKQQDQATLESLQHRQKMGEDVSQDMIAWYAEVLASDAYTTKEHNKYTEEQYAYVKQMREAELSNAKKSWQYDIDMGVITKDEYIQRLKERLNAKVDSAETEKAILKEVYDYEKSLAEEEISKVAKFDIGTTDIEASKARLVQYTALLEKYPEFAQSINEKIAVENENMQSLLQDGQTSYVDAAIEQERQYIATMESMVGIVDESGKKIVFTAEDKANSLKKIIAINQQYIDELLKSEANMNADQRKLLEARIKQNEAANKELQNLLLETTRAYQNAQNEITEISQEASKQIAAAQADLSKSIEQTTKARNEAIDNANKKELESQAKINNEKIAEEKRLTKAYDDELDKRTKSIANFTGIFQGITKKDVSGKELLQNMRDQLDVLKQWKKDLATLEDMGLSETLLKEFEGMGPASADEIRALTTLTEAELKEYSDLYAEKFSLAGEIAENQMADQREQLEKDLMEVRATADAQLDALKQETADAIQAINDNADEALDGFKEKFNETLAGINATAGEQIAKLQKTMSENVMPEDIAQFNIKSILENYGELNLESANQQIAMETQANNTRSGLDNIYSLLQQDFYDNGVLAGQGLHDGLSSMEPAIIAQAQNIAQAIKDALSSALGIASPSRVTFEQGVFTGLGLANGMESTISLVAATSAKMGAAAIPDISEPDSGYSITGNTGSHGAKVVEITQNQYFNIPQNDLTFQVGRQSKRSAEWGANQ